jgi:hypothetical protein
MRKNFTTTVKIAFALLILTVGSVACKKDAKPETAALQFQHASPDLANVNVSVDGNKVNTAALSYNLNTGYLSVNAGSRAVKITNATTGAVLLTTNVSLVKDRNYSYVIANRATSLEGLLVDDYQAAKVAGNAHVRVLNMSPDAPAYNVAIAGATTNSFTAAAFKMPSAFTTMVATDAGTVVSFQIKHPTSNAVVNTLSATLVAGKVYTILIRGLVTPPTGSTNTIGATVITNR